MVITCTFHIMNDQEHHQNKQKASLSIKKARGTIDTVMAMVEDDAYCPDIIQQIDAVTGLLNSAKKKLLVGHLDHCLQDELQKNKPKAVQELIKIFGLK